MKKILIFIAMTTILTINVYAQQPFNCNDGPFVSGIFTGGSVTTLRSINATMIPFQFSEVQSNNNSLNFNGIGYRVTDNLIYGMSDNGPSSTSNELIQIDANGQVINLGAITDLPDDRFISGEFDNNGIFYTLNASNDILFVINIDTMSVINQLVLNTNLRFSDIAFNPIDEMLYAVSTINTIAPELAGQLLRINPVSGNIDNIGIASNDFTGVGSLSFDANGTLYGIDNLTAGIYEINTQTGIRTLLSAAPNLSRSDGAQCINAVFPTIQAPEPTVIPTLNQYTLVILLLLLVTTAQLAIKRD